MKLGVCYYPEHWPRERWRGDAEHMRSIGITVVRIGEFAWSQLEPAQGDYRFAWLVEAIDTLHAAGLEVVVGTPTACPPKWLVDQHPEILPVGEDGRVRGFGSRRHYDFSSLRYRELCRGIVTRLADAVGSHPGVVAWQTDNEYGCHDTIASYSPAAVAAFRQWCAAQYKTVDALNTAWGNDFWSLNYPDFESIEAPAGTVTETSPAHRLAWWRFSSDQVVQFNREQVAILRERSPGRDLMHNYMGNFTAFDHHAVARDLDVAGWDNYPLGFLDRDAATESDRLRWLRTGHPDDSAFHHDLYRGLGHAQAGRWWLVEQQPGPVNWAAHNAAPLDGMLRLWGLEAAAHGAELCSVFRYRQQPRAQEQFHAGVLLPDGSEAPAADELRALDANLKRLGALDATGQAPVAMVFDYGGQAALESAPQGANASPLDAAKDWYRALRAAGQSVDILPPDAPFEGYSLVLLVNSAVLSDALIERLDASGATVIATARTGSFDGDCAIPDNLAPGALQRVLPLRVIQVESLPDAVFEPVACDGGLNAWRWRERVDSELPARARFADGWGFHYCRGNWHYVNARLDPESCTRFVAARLVELGLPVTRCEGGLRLRQRGDRVFAFNYGPDVVELPHDGPFELGTKHLAVADVAVWRCNA